MLGSKQKCTNCHGTSFRRVKVNRTIQCESCKLILEERCMSDLTEYHAITQTEEVHCVVTPDHLHNFLVDDIPNDPYCTPGFISGFRMLSPLREPVYAATARTLSGSLAEMERLIGDALFAGYVGYNGRAPGSTAKKDEGSDVAERNKSGGDARHTLVAYFEIVELASILCVDRETANLAIRTFRHTANNTSLRNRNVESLATAAFVSAAERRWHDYQEWLKHRDGSIEGGDESNAGDESLGGDKEKYSEEWPTPPRHISVEEIAAAANLDVSEVLRYLKVVNVALRKQRPENSSSITTHMPMFCRRLELPPKTRKLAIGIAEKAMENNICSRRNPVSISAAAIYLACQLDGIRKTQTEICRATTLTEVTLRKVYKELNAQQAALLPDWYQRGEQKETERSLEEGDRPFSRYSHNKSLKTDGGSQPVSDSMEEAGKTEDVLNEVQKQSIPLEPPPLPPGFEEGITNANCDDAQKVPEVASSMPAPSNATGGDSNAMLAMLNNPALQAFANAFSMMPQLMPPPPPPLPSPSKGKGQSQGDGEQSQAQAGNGDATTCAGQSAADSTKTGPTKGDHKENLEGNPTLSSAGNSVVQSRPLGLPSTGMPLLGTAQSKGQTRQSQASPQPSESVMAGMQSMMGMMQAMQALQAMQQQMSSGRQVGSEAVNPFAIMATAMAQVQNGGNVQGNQSMTAAGQTPDNKSNSAVADKVPPPADGKESASEGTETGKGT